MKLSKTTTTNTDDFDAIFFGETAEPETSWLIDQLIPAKGVTVLSGDTGTGKSFLAIDLAYHVRSGLSWFGMRPADPSPVLMLINQGAGGIGGRLRAYLLHHGQPKADVAIHLDPPDIDDENFAEQVVAMARGVEAQVGQSIGMIVLDALVTGNPAVAMRRLHAISDKLSCAIVVTYIPGRSRAIVDEADSVLTLLDVNGTITMSHENAKPIRFRLKRVVIGHDEDGHEITSCIVAPVQLKIISTSRGSNGTSANHSSLSLAA